MSTRGLDNGVGYFGQIMPPDEHIILRKEDRFFQNSLTKYKVKWSCTGLAAGFAYGHAVAMWRGYPFKAYRKSVFQSTLRGYALVLPYMLWKPTVTKNNGKKDMRSCIEVSMVTGGVWGLIFRGTVGHLLNGVMVGLPAGAMIWFGREYIYKPIKYSVFQSKTEYSPPGWFPIQPLNSYDMLEKEIRKEKLDILYPEDFDEDGNYVEQSQQVLPGFM